MPKLRVLPLGGLGEIGMNCLVLEEDGHAIVVDCGVTFDDRGLGVDVVHPRFDALAALTLDGIVLTHGHEDHIGAVPHLLRLWDVPVWGPRYAIGLLRDRAREHEVLGHARFREFYPRQHFAVGPFEIEPIRVTHSIADACALAIRTSQGLIVHTGDFKFDENPTDGETFDEARLRELGDEGVALLFSDSTNIDSPGLAGSEHDVGDALSRIVREAPGAVVVTLFASNVHRLRLLFRIAGETGRKVVRLGRGVMRHASVAASSGYLSWPADLTWPLAQTSELPRSRILALATGSQAETRAAMARLARNEFPDFRLAPDDTVIFSSRVIPGKEPAVYNMMAELLRLGVRVHSRATDRGVHVSGHAHRDEQERMLRLVRPHAFIPVHGTLHHLLRHAELARSVGVPKTLVIENGQTATLEDGNLLQEGSHPSGRVCLFDSKLPVPDSVIRERRKLAEGGFVAVFVTIDGTRETPRAEVQILSRGVILEELEASLRRNIEQAIPDLLGVKDDLALEERIRLHTRRTFSEAVGYRPLTAVQVVDRRTT